MKTIEKEVKRIHKIQTLIKKKEAEIESLRNEWEELLKEIE